MCGRFSLGLPRDKIQHVVHVGRWVDENRFVPRFNIAPRSYAPVIRRESTEAGERSTDLVLQTMKWGLVPHWSKHEDKNLSTTNARSENLVEGGSGGIWGSIKGRKRCAVVCQGYYEWLKKDRDRFPHFTKHKNGKLMFLAGLYDDVILEGETEPLFTFTIVTTSANKEFSWLHDRQPVILSSQEALDAWLDTSAHAWTPELTKLVEPYHDVRSPLQCYQVPKEVGKVGTESPSFIEPISQRKDGIQAMFSKQKHMRSSPEKGSSQKEGKRKRSSSPLLLDDSKAPPPGAGSSQDDRLQPKKSKTETDEVPEDEVVWVGDSPGLSKAESTVSKLEDDKSPMKARLHKPASNTKVTPKPKTSKKAFKDPPKSSNSSNKITQFFPKV